MNNRKALTIGINQYQNYPQNALRGCIHDTKNMSLILKEVLNFKDSDITVLQDSEATKENIYKNIDSLIKKSQDGECDHVVIHYAAHGTQIPDISGDETEDLKDEVFTTYNLNVEEGNWSPGTVIDDDDFGKKLSAIPEKCLCEVYLDTCHSGTGLRLLSLDEIPRYIAPPREINRELSNPLVENHGLADTLKDEGMPPNVVLMTGCQSDQTSADANIENEYNGAFTWNLCNELRKSDNQLSRYELMKNIRNAMRDRYNQIPQLEGVSGIKDLPLGQLK
jgi:metacaspase-1